MLLVSLICFAFQSQVNGQVQVPDVTITGSTEVSCWGVEQFYFAIPSYNDPAIAYKWSLDGVPLSYSSYAIPIRFQPQDAGWHVLSCQAEKTVIIGRDVFKYTGKLFNLSINVVCYRSAQTSSNFSVMNNMNTLVVSSIEKDTNMGKTEDNTTLTYQLNSVVSAVSVKKGIVNANNGTIDVTNVPKGVYILILTTDAGYTETHKISI